MQGSLLMNFREPGHPASRQHIPFSSLWPRKHPSPWELASSYSKSSKVLHKQARKPSKRWWPQIWNSVFCGVFILRLLLGTAVDYSRETLRESQNHGRPFLWYSACSSELILACPSLSSFPWYVWKGRNYKVGSVYQVNPDVATNCWQRQFSAVSTLSSYSIASGTVACRPCLLATWSIYAGL